MARESRQRPQKKTTPFGGREKLKAALHPAEAKLQGAAMLTRRIMLTEGHKEIARLFNLSPATVGKRLAEARTGDLHQLARDIIAERMVPKALGILDAELDKGNFDAAKEVLKGTQILQAGGRSVIEHIASTTPTIDQIRKEMAKTVDAESVVPVETPS